MTSSNKEEDDEEEQAKEQAKIVDAILETDYHITEQEMLTYMAEEKEREYDSTLPYEAGQQVKTQLDLVSKEIAEQMNKRSDGKRYGFDDSEILEQQAAIEQANRLHTQHRMQIYKENLRNMMISFEQDRLRLITWLRDRQAGREPRVQINSEEELNELIQFMSGLKHQIDDAQKELKEWEEQEEQKKK